MNLFALVSLSSAVLCFALTIFSFLAGRTKSYRVLLLFNVATVFWGAGCFIAGISTTEKFALFGWKLAHFGGFFIAPFFYHLVSVFCNLPRKKIIFLAYLQGIIFNILSFSTDVVISKTRFIFNIFYNEATPAYAIAVFFYLALVMLSYFELFRFLLTAHGDMRTRAKYIVFSFIFGFAGGSTILLPEFKIDAVYPLGNLGLALSAPIITYAILRRKVLDIDEVIQIAQREKLAAVGVLAASVNHELKNPLFIIRGNLEIGLRRLKEENEGPQKPAETVSPLLEKALFQLDRASELMQRLSDFARPELGFIRDERISVAEAFERVLELVNYQFKLGKIRLTQQIDSTLEIIFNKRQFEEVLFNLILNACQAMPGGGELLLEAQKNNGSILIRTLDSGKGIASSDRGKVFDAFYATKGKEGTGLGLYITKQLLERPGGKIWFESSSKGTSSFVEFKETR